MADAETTELKGGHAPAVKAGGMRVAQHKPSKPEEKPAPAAAEEGDEEQAVAVKEKPASVMIAGFESQGDKDFPPAAVKSFHEKPMPTHDKRPNHTPVKQIQQPRKQ